MLRSGAFLSEVIFQAWIVDSPEVPSGFTLKIRFLKDTVAVLVLVYKIQKVFFSIETDGVGGQI